MPPASIKNTKLLTVIARLVHKHVGLDHQFFSSYCEKEWLIYIDASGYHLGKAQMMGFPNRVEYQKEWTALTHSPLLKWYNTLTRHKGMFDE